MKATGFEVRHELLLHLLVVGLALLTYAVNPDDIVWAFVRGHSNNRMLERLVFGTGAIVVMGSAWLETWVTVRDRAVEQERFAGGFERVLEHRETALGLARLLFAAGLGLLLPWPGTVVLMGGETILVLRLLTAHRETAAPVPSAQAEAEPSWRKGLRVSASKWGVAASLLLLSITLQDRIAEITAGIGFLAWSITNGHRSLRSGVRS